MYTVITNGVGPGANLDDDIVINEASLDRAKHDGMSRRRTWPRGARSNGSFGWHMLCLIRFKEEDLAVLLMRQLTGSAGLPSRLSIGGNDQGQNLLTRQVETPITEG